MDILQHPAHPHSLYHRKLSEHCNLLKCTVCSSRIQASTSMYCCERCEVYLHPSCTAEVPRQLEHHPLHLDHPLIIGEGDINRYQRIDRGICCGYCGTRLDGWGFYCSSCPYDLHVGCAMLNLPQDEEYGPVKATFEYFAHKCPLASLNVRHECDIQCNACGLQLSGEVYGCRRCVFFLHKTCAESPHEMRRHPFHSHHPLTLGRPQNALPHCRACDRWVDTAYCCEDCGFYLCLGCTSAPLPLGCLREETQDSRPPTGHFFHQHPLAFYCAGKEMQVRCKACDQQVSGEFYGCPDCSFFVHEPCVQSLSKDIKHYLHPFPDHPLTLSATPLDPSEEFKRCGSCDCSLSRDFSYNCKECDFYLHVPCALQTLAYVEQGASKSIVNQKEKYELTLYHERGYFVTNCYGCLKKLQGPCYRCNEIELHKSCALPLSNLDPFHHQHRLVLDEPDLVEEMNFLKSEESWRDILDPLHPSNLVCNVCGESIVGNRIRYRCEECDNFKLHSACVQSPTLKHPLHAHVLTHIQRQRESESRCRACGKPCAVDFCCCVLCDVQVHYDCLQLPQTIKSNHHIDELTLHESIVEDDSGEYYCDICEQRRDPELWAYYCKVCKLIAHVICAVSPVKLNGVLVNPEAEELDEVIERVQQEVDRGKAKLEELTAKLEELTTRRRCSL